MTRIRPSSIRQSLGKPTLFSHLGSLALDQVCREGLGGQSYMPLSGLLHVCAYMYETGAILGRASQGRLLELMSMSFDTEEVEYHLAELRYMLRRRLEASGRYAHSLYTFYLHITMQDMNMNFDINDMRVARNDIRHRIEARHFMEYAGAEGLLLGGWYPDLAEKMYGREYGPQEEIINEMTGGTALLPEETAIASIRERESLILDKVRTFVSQYRAGPADTSRRTLTEDCRPEGTRPEMKSRQPVEAYLDIETTGLNPSGCDITVIGIHICDNGSSRFVQIIDKNITEQSILEALQGVSIIYTYNGSRFDLPFIYSAIGINLTKLFRHVDLMYDCWRRNLYGGLKRVEQHLGISRRLKGIDGYEAVKLWRRYMDSSDLDALNTLLEYNREDVVNLKFLKERLI